MKAQVSAVVGVLAIAAASGWLVPGAAIGDPIDYCEFETAELDEPLSGVTVEQVTVVDDAERPDWLEQNGELVFFSDGRALEIVLDDGTRIVLEAR